MMRDVRNGAVLAETDHAVNVEGTEHFPPGSPRREYFGDSTCAWDRRARCRHVGVNGTVNQDAAWCYPRPSAARAIAERVVFGHRARVKRVRGPGEETRPGPAAASARR